MIRFLTFVAVALAGCTTVPPGGLALLPVDGGTPLGANLLQHARYLNDLNVSIGEEPILFAASTPNSERILRTIQGRLATDIPRFCPTTQGAADAAYLLIGERRARNVAFLIRLRDATPEGEYMPMCGLVYSLDKSTGRILSVTSNSY
jgi:hypothetical protein